MTAVKIGQVWQDKDKRRNTVIEIIAVGKGPFEGSVTGLVVGTEEEREYSVDRLTKRWKLVKEAPEPKPEEPAPLHLSEAVEAVRERGAVLKVIANDREQTVEIPKRTRPKQGVYMLKVVSPHNSDYKVRMTQKMIDDYGYPTDPWGDQMELAD